jgi:hypothetical protein
MDLNSPTQNPTESLESTPAPVVVDDGLRRRWQVKDNALNTRNAVGDQLVQSKSGFPKP